MSEGIKVNEGEIIDLKKCRGCVLVKCVSFRLFKFNSICLG